MKIYLDTCCLNRPFDSQDQERVRLESEAVLFILSRCRDGKWRLAASDILDMELAESPNLAKLARVRALYSLAHERLTVTAEVRARAQRLQESGMKIFDSLHLALAETYRQNVLLTTDDSFLSAAHGAGTTIAVANPATWLMEEARYGR